MNPELLYFDTNFFYGVASGKISKRILDRFIACAKREKIKLFYTPITFIEVACHINRHEVRKFKHYQNVLEHIRNVCGNNILENPDHILATILGVPSPEIPERGSPSDLNAVRDLICNAKDYNQLIQGQNLYWDGRLSRVKYQEDVAKNFRADYEERWILDMYSFVVNTVNPKYFETLREGKTPKVTNKNLGKKLIEFLDSIQFRKFFADACFCKATGLTEESLIGNLSEARVEQLLKRISAYFTAYKTIIRNIVEKGYNVSKNKNDLNDLHFLIYLGLGSRTRFVTYDGKLKEKIKGSNQESQVTTIEEVIGGNR